MLIDMTYTTTHRTYNVHDILANPEGGPVAHLSYQGPHDDYGHWYSLCGRVVPSYRRWTLEDTDHDRVCAACDKKANRHRGRNR